MKLVILGAGQFGQVVKELALNQYDEIIFLDDISELAKGKLDSFLIYKDDDFIVAMGNPDIREFWLTKLKENNLHIVSIISPYSYVAPSVTLGNGCVVEAMAVINTNAVIKTGVFINAGAIINHNATVGDYSQIDCGAVVASSAIVAPKSHIHYNQVVTK